MPRPPLESFTIDRPPLESFTMGAAGPLADTPKEDVSAGMALRGIPVLGAYIPQAEAAIRAAAQPFTGVGKPGATYAERYAANLPEREAQYAQAEQDSPITSEVVKAGGGALALAPLGATALGARALGITGGIGSRLALGGASGAGISAADTAARGGDAEAIQSAAKWGGGIGAGAGAIFGRAISPLTRDPTRAAAVRTLEAEGVQPSAGTITGNRALQYAEQHLGELSGQNVGERTAEQFTGAALRRAGETGNRATQDVVDNAFTRIGNQFDRLAANNTLHPDQAMGPQIRQAVANYDRLTAPPSRIPAVRQYEEEIANHLATNRGTIPGDAYQSLRSRMETEARNTQSSELADALRGMRGALDDAMERHLTRIGSSDAGAWRQARNQYRNLLVIERAVTSPGADAQLGLISPAALYNATRNVQGRRNLARGRGDYADLAQAGSALLRKQPSSGTAQRLFMQSIPGAIGAGYGALQGGDSGSAVLGAAAGIGGPMAAGRLINSRAMQRYLANQMMTRPGGQALQAGATGGLLNLIQ